MFIKNKDVTSCFISLFSKNIKENSEKGVRTSAS